MSHFETIGKKCRFHSFKFVDANDPDGPKSCWCGAREGEKGKNKYNARKTPFRGALYDSQKESDRAYELEMMRRAGQIKKVERQVQLELRVHGQLVAKYKVDFRITHNDGSIELEEVKGRWTPDARIKWNLLDAIYSVEHPDIKLTVIR